MEEPINDRLPFLGTMVKNLPSGDFEKSVYHKETNVDAVLQLESSHPAFQKRSCV